MTVAYSLSSINISKKYQTFLVRICPWRLGSRCQCALSLFHGKAKWQVIVVLLRGISTRPWNKEGVQWHLNLNRYGYSSRYAKKAEQQDAVMPCCTSDEGRPLGVAGQAEIPGHPELHSLRAVVVSVMEKSKSTSVR